MVTRVASSCGTRAKKSFEKAPLDSRAAALSCHRSNRARSPTARQDVPSNAVQAVVAVQTKDKDDRANNRP
jgi:hypothetical protein